MDIWSVVCDLFSYGDSKFVMIVPNNGISSYENLRFILRWLLLTQAKPTIIIDKIIQFWVDLVTPGGGFGQDNFFQRTFRSLEQSSQRTSVELDIRQSLRDWDRQYPQIHHELIVRYLCGALVSVAATSLYNSFTRKPNNRPYDR